jgi:16S rRNA C967 or C1407 C5-methylase (RsmB/RsmF family)
MALERDCNNHTRQQVFYEVGGKRVRNLINNLKKKGIESIELIQKEKRRKKTIKNK